MATKVYAHGEILVTKTGDIIIDEVLPRHRALLAQPEVYVTVEFDPKDPGPAPCDHCGEDELEWELFFKSSKENGHMFPSINNEELRLKIMWNVHAPRTVLWSVRVPG